MIKRLVLTISLIGVFMIGSPAPALAKNILSGVDCSRAANSTICEERDNKNDPLSGDDGVLINITNIIAFVGGAAAVIMIVYGAIRLIVSGSDISTGARQDTDVEKARDTIAYALVGLAVIVLARTIIIFVLNKL